MDDEIEPHREGIPRETTFVRTVRSKIFEIKDYIMRCTSSQQSLNGWRLLCELEFGIVMDLASKKKLPANSVERNWNEYVDELGKEFNELKTSEKTVINCFRCGNERTYHVQWDNYSGEFEPAEFIDGMKVLDREKYDAICHRLMQLAGKFEFVLFACNLLNIEDKIDVPVPLDQYTEEHLEEGVTSRKARYGSR